MADADAELFQGLAAAPGEESLRWIVRHLTRTLGCEWAFVLERCGVEWDCTRVVAASRHGVAADLPLEFPATGTPFEASARGRSLVVERGLRTRFPAFPAGAALGGEACVAIALDDDAGRALGHLALIDPRPLDDRAAWLAALESLRTRVAGELATRSVVRELEVLLASTRAESSSDRLKSLALGLARALRVGTGFVCELVPERPDRVRTVGFSIGGREQPPLEYALADTPCRDVYEQKLVFVPDDVQAAFPRDVFLKKLGSRSFLGVRLDAPDGRPLGHLGVLHSLPLDARIVALPIVRVYADRAAAELARRRGETERLRIERRLADAHIIESLGVLAAGIAHDFNNLLGGILGHATLALAATTDPERERPLRGHLRDIEAAARRAAELAQQMLAYAGRAAIDLRPHDLNWLVDEASARLAARLPPPVRLDLALSPDLPAVAADAAQLRQVALHLLANAVEAIGDGSGSIRVATGRVTLDRTLLERLGPSELQEGEHVFLEVADNGRGMDAATRARIFEPFFTTKEPGRGLGLAAVAGIVRSHRAAITVASEPGRGATFRLFLPVCDEPAHETIRSLPAAGAARSGLVLVVDDEELVRTATAKMLERLGYTVCAVPDGRAGVSLLAERGRDVRLVLLDLAMPGFTGEEAFHEMRRVAADASIVLMSGYTDHDATRRLRSAGVAGFLQKPFGLAELERCVVRAMASDPDDSAAA